MPVHSIEERVYKPLKTTNMKTQFNTGYSSIDRELTSILEQRDSRVYTPAKVSSKAGKRAVEVTAALIVPVVVFTIILVLNHFNLIKNF